MKRLVLIACILAGCSTTPNTEDQYMQQDARAEHVRWKAWCLSQDGVVVEDDSIGRGDRKCYSREEWNRAIYQ